MVQHHLRKPRTGGNFGSIFQQNRGLKWKSNSVQSNKDTYTYPLPEGCSLCSLHSIAAHPSILELPSGSDQSQWAPRQLVSMTVDCPPMPYPFRLMQVQGLERACKEAGKPRSFLTVQSSVASHLHHRNTGICESLPLLFKWVEFCFGLLTGVRQAGVGELDFLRLRHSGREVASKPRAPVPPA